MGSEGRRESVTALEILLEIDLPFMARPTERSAMVDGIFYVGPRAALHQQAHHRFMTGTDGLVQRCRVSVKTGRVKTVWIFAGIQEQAHDIGVTMCRGQSQGCVTFGGVASASK